MNLMRLESKPIFPINLESIKYRFGYNGYATNKCGYVAIYDHKNKKRLKHWIIYHLCGD